MELYECGLSEQEATDRFNKVVGEVSSGLGEGRYYISRKSYIIQFQEKLGFIPFLGTLNIRVSQEFPYSS